MECFLGGRCFIISSDLRVTISCTHNCPLVLHYGLRLAARSWTYPTGPAEDDCQAICVVSLQEKSGVGLAYAARGVHG